MRVFFLATFAIRDGKNNKRLRERETEVQQYKVNTSESKSMERLLLLESTRLSAIILRKMTKSLRLKEKELFLEESCFVLKKGYAFFDWLIYKKEYLSNILITFLKKLRRLYKNFFQRCFSLIIIIKIVIIIINSSESN